LVAAVLGAEKTSKGALINHGLGLFWLSDLFAYFFCRVLLSYLFMSLLVPSSFILSLQFCHDGCGDDALVK
jgi:hypothetical protein